MAVRVRPRPVGEAASKRLISCSDIFIKFASCSVRTLLSGSFYFEDGNLATIKRREFRKLRIGFFTVDFSF
jgi:hypothetical protein